MKNKICKLEKLNTLNQICQSSTNGIYKQWIYNKEDFMKICNYMQKINYSIQDINNLIDELNEFDRKNIICLIVYVDWIRESFNSIYNNINKKVIANYDYKKENEFCKAKSYFKAIRSFIVAHPLNTTNHSNFGLDGNYICIDIRDYQGIISLRDDAFYYHLSYNGLIKDRSDDYDFFLYCYSNKDDNMKYTRKISCSYSDIINVAKCYIEKLYDLNKYLKRQKKNNIIV